MELDAPALQQDLETQGYFELPRALPASSIERVRADLERVTARGAPAVAAFLDDAMWELLDRIVPIARAALGGEVAILPAFWAWQIAPGDQGWSPHRDRPDHAFRADDKPAEITIWIALTDATPRNGCIHVVPAYWDYEYRNPGSRCEVAQQQHLRALPALAGSVLGWTHALLHWGGACAPGEPPRLSTSFELVLADHAGGHATHPAGWRPSRDERVAIVGEALVQYAHMHDVTDVERAAIASIVAGMR